MIKTYFSIGVLLIVSACEGNSLKIKTQHGDVISSISTGEKTDKELKESLAQVIKEGENKLSSFTTLSFDKLNHDFGNVEAEKENRAEFTVKNTGNTPLIISKVSASCGCTTPKKPNGPILPGETDFIEVVFKSKVGQKNEIKKTVTVTANTAEKVHLLEIRAFVK
jgi:LysM repeat protein